MEMVVGFCLRDSRYRLNIKKYLSNFELIGWRSSPFRETPIEELHKILMQEYILIDINREQCFTLFLILYKSNIRLRLFPS